MERVFFDNPFWNYWALTFAVFLIYLFSFVVAGMDLREELAEARRKAQQRRGRVQPRFENPLADRTVAQTLDPGRNRTLPPHLQWVHDQVDPIARKLGIQARILVYEDSKGHPLVHLTDGQRLVSYRLDKALAQEAREDAAKLREVQDRLERFMRLEWLGDETAMQRTTELAREARSQAKPEAPAASARTPEMAVANPGEEDPRAAERRRILEEARARAAARKSPPSEE
ncbi:MAG: hypothetical protein QN143_01820 [Armatimonadota bacterium]|nr:hypothetical protein [Armatimonadota bacterium]